MAEKAPSTSKTRAFNALAPVRRAIKNPGALFTVVNAAWFWTTPACWPMVGVAITGIFLATQKSRKGQDRAFFNRQDLSILLTGLPLVIAAITTVGTGIMTPVLASGLGVLGACHVADWLAIALQKSLDIKESNQPETFGGRLAKAFVNQTQRWVPWGRSAGNLLVIASVGAGPLLSLPAYLSTAAGIYFGIKKRKDLSFAALSISSALSVILLPFGQFSWSSLSARSLVTVGQYQRFQQERALRLERIDKIPAPKSTEKDIVATPRSQAIKTPATLSQRLSLANIFNILRISKNVVSQSPQPLPLKPKDDKNAPS